MGSKRIEQAIEELEDYIAQCKPKGFSGTQVIVSKEEIFDRLDEMKLKVPDEINRCNKLLDRRDEILREAEAKAQKIIEDAQLKAEAMVHDSEIMRQAYLQANEFISRANAQADETVNQANYEANIIRDGAYEYTKDMLSTIEAILQNAYNETKAKSEQLLDSLYENLDIVIANKKELCEDVAPEYDDVPAENETPVDYSFTSDEEQVDDEGSDDFDVNPDSFLKNIE